jgi:hypothetical protein
MQKLAGLSEASGEDMGDNMYGITKEFKFGSEPGGPFKLELFSNGDMGISDGDNYLGLTNKDAKELSEILKQIMGKVNEEQLDEAYEFDPASYFSAMDSNDPNAKAFIQNIKKAADSDLSKRYSIVNKLKDHAKANPEVKGKLDAAIEFINS